MADTKISALPPVPSIAGTEVIPVAKSGTTQGATVNQIKTYLGVSGTNTGDQDLSGLVPKTTTVNSHPLSSNVVVTASDVGLGNVDNTSDANKPVSTATSTALSGKQDTLVSGTNIKTINGSTVLGSGNLVISGSGTVTTVGVATANGFAGTVSNPTTTPLITLTTNIVGVVKGNGTALSSAVAGTDYLVPPSGTSVLKANSGGALVAAVNSDLPVMTATVGGAVPTPPNNTTTFLRGDGTFATPPSGTILSGFQNIAINGGFTINNRAYTSGAALSSGSYGHDRWKAGSGGGDYSFTQLKSNTQITIAANKTLIQVIEDVNVQATSYILSWTGTCQARYAVNSATPSGSYASSPITITGQTVGTTMSIEFGNGASSGTLGTVSLTPGSTAPSSYEQRPYAAELMLCYRYLPPWVNSAGLQYASTVAFVSHSFPVAARVAPTGLVMSSLPVLITTSGGVAANSSTFNSATTLGAFTVLLTASGLTVGDGTATYGGQGYYTGCEL